MRDLLPDIMFPTIWHSGTSGWGSGGSYNPSERKKEIEERLRTYLMAGIRPEELEHEARTVAEVSEAQRLSFCNQHPEKPT